MSINHAFLKVTGLTKDQIIGKRIEEVIPEPSVRLVSDNYKKAIEENRIIRWEETSVYPRGENIGEVSIAPVLNEKGTCTHLVGSVHDITERKCAEDLLRESEEKYRILVEAIPHGISENDLQGTLTYANPANHRILGYESDELVGMSAFDLQPSHSDRQAMQDFIATLVQEQPPPTPVITQNLRKDGTIIDVQLDWNYKRDKDGNINGFVLIVTDITERKQAEEAQRNAEQEYLNLIERANDGILITQDAHVRFVNQRFADLLGYTREEMKDTPQIRYVHPDLVSDSIERTRRHKVDVPVETAHENILRHKGGAGIDVEVNAIAIVFEGKASNLVFVRDITERKRAEESFRESDERFRKLTQLSPVGIFVADQHGDATYWNDQLFAITGLTEEEVKGEGWAKGLHPEDRDRIINEWYDESVKTNMKFKSEYRFIDRNGNITWVIGETASLIDSRGEATGYIGTITDITERKRAEEALLESEFRFRSLFDNMNTGVAVYKAEKDGEDFIFVDFNNAGEQIDNVSKEDLIGKSVLKMFPGIRDFGIFDIFQKVWKTGKPEHYPIARYKDERISGWRDNFIYKLPSGEIVAVYSDETERKQAEEALQESEVKYRNLFESIPIGLYRSTPDGSIIDVNSDMVQLFNYPDKESFISSKSTDTYVDSEERNIWKAVMKDKGMIKGNVKHLRTRDGRMIWVEENARAAYDDEGRVKWYDGSLIDITERKNLEAQLRQSQKMESLGTLAGGIAHEFNNILGIILGNTELAIDDVPEWNPAKECLKEIRAASMRAKDVVRHILSFARKTPVQRKPIQISTIIRDSLKMMRASIPTTIEIRQNISCESEMILADPTEINQILMNFCTNSVHALSEETGVIEVTLENEKIKVKNEELGLDAGRYVKLTVKDTGQGIDPKIMDQIFDPYFTTKDIGKGTGMGLAVGYGIIKKHDGAIKASSELGIGTVVEVLFPLIDEGAEKEAEEEPQTLPTGTERILLIDDEKSMLKAVAMMLGRLGYQVVPKTNPKEALSLFKAETDQFDVVITDMAMPQMAGDRLAQELMKIRQNIPVILCTGHSARMDEDRAKELGLAAYVMKPLIIRDFATTVRRVLDAAKASTQK